MIALLLGPTGAGKSAVIRQLVIQYGLQYIRPFVTRPLRPGETDKISVSAERFEILTDESKFIIVNRLFQTCYGTPRQEFEDGLKGSAITHLLDFPLEAVEKIRHYAPAICGAVVMPPNWPTLSERLKSAGRGDRLALARSQMDEYVSLYLADEHPLIKNRFVFNHEISDTVSEIAKLLKIEAPQ